MARMWGAGLRPVVRGTFLHHVYGGTLLLLLLVERNDNLSGKSMTRERHESVMRIVMNGKHLHIRPLLEGLLSYEMLSKSIKILP